MPIPLDRRSRREADCRATSPETFFRETFPALAEANGAMIAEALAELSGRPLTISVDGSPWTVLTDGAGIAAEPRAIDNAVEVRLTAAQFSDFAQNLVSFNGLITARALRFEGDDLYQVSLWDSLWLTLLDAWPAVTANIDFLDRQGSPLDLSRTFCPDDDPADIAHFLREAGYLHLRGWLDRETIERISLDFDRALPKYREGDRVSWWAALADGTRTCVRMQEFEKHSETIAGLVGGEAWNRMRLVIAEGDPLVDQPSERRMIEALVKPISVIAGPSDLSFHRDCHLGRHVYDCSHVTVGIAITPSSKANGLLQVIAGSHRVAMPVEIAKTAPYLPLVEVETEPGDMTVHLSCTLHASTPPKFAERRVAYAPMMLAGGGRLLGDDLGDLRERVADIARQEHEAES